MGLATTVMAEASDQSNDFQTKTLWRISISTVSAASFTPCSSRELHGRTCGAAIPVRSIPAGEPREPRACPSCIKDMFSKLLPNKKNRHGRRPYRVLRYPKLGPGELWDAAAEIEKLGDHILEGL